MCARPLNELTRGDVLERLEALDGGRQEDECWEPLFFCIGDHNSCGALRRLLDSGRVDRVRDAIAMQLEELIETRNPRRPPLEPHEVAGLVSRHLGGVPMAEYGTWVFYPWSGALVHILPEPEFRELRSSRNRNKITAEEQERLGRLDVAVAGLSVGRATAVTLATEGVGGHLRLADFDRLSLSNMNRIQASIDEVGVNKAVLTARRILEINPYLRVSVLTEGVTPDNIEAFLTQERTIDLLFEECDDLEMKIRLREAARDLKIPVLMETSDRGMIDIERFDLEPDRPILHGLVGDLKSDQLRGLDTYAKVPTVLDIIGARTLSRRMAASLIDIDATLKTWPQLGSAVALGGALNVDTARRIALGQLTVSGRFHVDLEEVVTEAGGASGRAGEVAVSSPTAPPMPVEEGLDDEPLPPLRPGRGPATALELQTLAAYANRAPSGGNSQPWKFEMRPTGLRCLVDPTRARTLLDYRMGAARLACGITAEYVHLAAGAMGLSAQIEVFPDPAVPELAYDAYLERQGTRGERDALLVGQIARRCTNRKLGPRVPLTREAVRDLQLAAMERGASLRLVEDERGLAKLSEILGRGDRLRFLSRRLHEELYSELRWTPQEARATRDGIDIRTLELDPTQRAAMSLTASWPVMETARAIGGGAGLERMAKDAVAASSGIGLLSIAGRGPEAFIEGGRALGRVWLMATALELSFQPMTALLYLFEQVDDGGVEALGAAEVTEIRELCTSFRTVFPYDPEHTPLMLFRLGTGGSPSARSLRRALDAVLFTTDSSLGSS